MAESIVSAATLSPCSVCVQRPRQVQVSQRRVHRAEQSLQPTPRLFGLERRTHQGVQWVGISCNILHQNVEKQNVSSSCAVVIESHLNPSTCVSEFLFTCSVYMLSLLFRVVSPLSRSYLCHFIGSGTDVNVTSVSLLQILTSALWTMAAARTFARIRSLALSVTAHLDSSWSTTRPAVVGCHLFNSCLF